MIDFLLFNIYMDSWLLFRCILLCLHYLYLIFWLFFGYLVKYGNYHYLLFFVDILRFILIVDHFS